MRQNPEDGHYYTFAQLQEKFDQVPAEEIEALWREKMKPRAVMEQRPEAAPAADAGAANSAVQQEEAGERRRGGSPPRARASEWKDDGAPINPTEKRQNPNDKFFYIYAEVQKMYAGQMSEQEVEAFWREKMKPWAVIQQQQQADEAGARRSRSRGERRRSRSRGGGRGPPRRSRSRRSRGGRYGSRAYGGRDRRSPPRRSPRRSPRRRSPQRRRSPPRRSRERGASGPRRGGSRARPSQDRGAGREERRLHPEDGQGFTLEQLREKMAGQPAEEVEAFWRERMTPQESQDGQGSQPDEKERARREEKRSEAAAWKDDGGPIQPEEKREHPDDGNLYTYQELSGKFAEQLKPEELEALWREKMKPEWVVQALKQEAPRRPRGRRSRSRRAGGGASATAAEWKDDGGPIKPDETRRHPEDKIYYSFEELKGKFGEQTSPEELEALWREKMKPRWVVNETEDRGRDGPRRRLRRSPSRRSRQRSRSRARGRLGLGLNRMRLRGKREERSRSRKLGAGPKGKAPRPGMIQEAKPEKLCGELWEEPRQKLGMQLVSDMARNVAAWQPVLEDESRRSFSSYLPGALSGDQCRHYFETIRDGTSWMQPEGKLGPIPRKTAWMTKRGCQCSYRYGGIEVEPTQYPPWMIELLQLIMPKCGLAEAEWPDSCNMNLYEDGGMSVGWHSDDERIFQGKFRDIIIISLSLGTRRKFELRLNWPDESERPVRRVMLGDGDLMTMEGMLQKHFMHRVPKEEGISDPRINLTWRWVMMHTPKCPSRRERREAMLIPRFLAPLEVPAAEQPTGGEQAAALPPPLGAPAPLGAPPPLGMPAPLGAPPLLGAPAPLGVPAPLGAPAPPGAPPGAPGVAGLFAKAAAPPPLQAPPPAPAQQLAQALAASLLAPVEAPSSDAVGYPGFNEAGW